MTSWFRLPFAISFQRYDIVIGTLLTVMIFVDPITYQVHEANINTDDGTDNTDGQWFGTCNFKEQAAYVISLALMLLVLLSFVCVQAWKASEIASEYSESKHIFGMLMSMNIIVRFSTIPH
jgi:hypothetical protein